MELKSEPEIVNTLKITGKKASPKRYETKVPKGIAKYQSECRPRGARCLFRAGGGIEGVQVFDSIWVPSSLLLI